MIGIFGAGEEGYGEGSAIPHGDSTYIMTEEILNETESSFATL